MHKMVRPGPDDAEGNASAMTPDPTSLWLLPEHAVDDFAAELGGQRLLTDDERARRRRLLTEGARRRYLAARLLCRYALTARTGRPMDQWRFRAGPFGRPEPDPDNNGVRFNLSHTDGLIACVVTQGRVCGVDVERPTASIRAASYLSRHFASAERAEISALAPDLRIRRVQELWVLKEAYLKALGTGLHRSLNGFSFARPDVGRITVRDPERPLGDGAHWWFDLLHVGPCHVLAVAAEGGRAGALHRTDLFAI